MNGANKADASEFTVCQFAIYIAAQVSNCSPSDSRHDV